MIRLINLLILQFTSLDIIIQSFDQTKVSDGCIKLQPSITAFLTVADSMCLHHMAIKKPLPFRFYQ